MAGTLQPQQLMDSEVVDPEGHKIGKVGNVYLADSTREPEWITVKTGLFGTKESFVPLSGASMDDKGVHVNVAKDLVSDAPRIDADGHLSSSESAELYRHYGLPMPRTAPDTSGGRGTSGPTPGRGERTAETRGMTGDRDRAGRAGEREQAARGTGDEGMIRSEERLKVGTEQVEAGHVRLRKYVVTEEQQVTVPVSHEEVRIEREPITDGRARTDGKLGEQEQDITLHAERAVVNKETVPVERVRLNTETVTEDQTVSGEVRKEQFDIQDDSSKRHRKS
ncbi:PRC and DUF2382 domain-containing protein [Amycolatopsis sp. PS_44_ISF1]|uniref:PRC and DUF2382 domain-containing protein n=1 Tax=Amycolatopsis sp. PS_44_ISF1 TaxID=2974917 RepID=UPI0028E02F70|nr:PRC and DUF2382 domain-containing protein [Amycolatopsis sp. PS_44_ISF1]MDT8913782.1 PRC and DUF2382 domain-containing protein [Amycolatopsis sp. PS_44_ISF1]